MPIISKDKKWGITKFKLWKFELTITSSEKSTIGSWKFGNKLVGSFTKIKG